MHHVSKIALRVGLYGIIGFLVFLVAFVFSNFLNPSLSRTGYKSDNAAQYSDFLSRVIYDIGITSPDAKYDLIQGLAIFMIASALINIGMLFVKRFWEIGEGQERLFLMGTIASPGAILVLGLVLFDFFTDDQSLRDTQSASYLTFGSSLDACFKLSVVALPILILIAMLTKTVRRREE